MPDSRNQIPPLIAWCSQVVKKMNGRSERFFILSMAREEQEVFSFHISETEARESYNIDFNSDERICNQLAVALYNGWFDEVKRKYG